MILKRRACPTFKAASAERLLGVLEHVLKVVDAILDSFDNGDFGHATRTLFRSIGL
ncbi:hypothetical protein D9M68_979170 [compost metagenome]